MVYTDHNGKRIRKSFTDQNGIHRAFAWLKVATPEELLGAGVTASEPEKPAQGKPRPTKQRPKESAQYKQIMESKEKYYGIVS